MATKRTYSFTSRSDGGETSAFKKARIKQLKALGRYLRLRNVSLTPEQLEELRKLLNATDSD